MEQHGIILEDDSGDKSFFTIVPNYILNHSSGLDQALYLQLKRLSGDGKKDYCYPSFNYLIKQLHVGEKALKKSFKYLIEHKWIDNLGKKHIMTGGGMQWVSAYKVNDIWPLNVAYYKGGSESDHPLSEVVSKSAKVAPKEAKEGLVVGANKERKENYIKEPVVSLLKNWNERQSSPIPSFKPENIVRKHGAERVSSLINQYGKCNGGFSMFLTALKELKSNES